MSTIKGHLNLRQQYEDRDNTYQFDGNYLSILTKGSVFRYNDEQYMLKFPPYPTRNKDMSYTNSCISEYIGCKIFELLDIPVQETMIGAYATKEKKWSK